MIAISDQQALSMVLGKIAPSNLIAVDGWMLAGKSYLARALAADLRRSWVDLDRFASGGVVGFVEQLDMAAVNEALLKSGPVVLSGVCIREVLEKVGGCEPVHVYVKRMHHGFWTDEVETAGEESVLDECAPPCSLRLEVRRYHAKWSPHLRANYGFEREVSAEGL